MCRHMGRVGGGAHSFTLLTHTVDWEFLPIKTFVCEIFTLIDLHHFSVLMHDENSRSVSGYEKDTYM